LLLIKEPWHCICEKDLKGLKKAENSSQMSTGLKIARCILPCINTPENKLQTSDVVTNVYAKHTIKGNWCLEIVMQRAYHCSQN